MHVAYSSSVLVPPLRALAKGRVIAPEDAGYDRARAIHFGGYDLRPGAIVRPVDAADVARVVTFARDSGIELAVRGGGHSGAGHGSTDGGVVLDLRDMKAIGIDAERRTAWAQTGLTAGDPAAVGAHGLATGFGDTGSVGIGGITLGGGIGFLTRKLGLTIDSLTAAEVVTADGTVRRVDAGSHRDLFWAIRGGGGNVGVATRLQFRLAPVDRVVGGMLLLPATSDVIAGFVDAAEAAPRGADDDRERHAAASDAVRSRAVPRDARRHGARLLRRRRGCRRARARSFRRLADPIADVIKPMRYPELFPPEEEMHPTAVGRTMFMETVDRAAAETMLDYLRASDASMRVAQIRVLGGAMRRVPSDATAFAHRTSRIMTNVAAFYDGPEDRSIREAWVAEFAAALDQGTSGAYVNFLLDEGEARVRAAYPGSTWDRLAAVKQRYDPGDLFRRNQNVPPAKSAHNMSACDGKWPGCRPSSHNWSNAAS